MDPGSGVVSMFLFLFLFFCVGEMRGLMLGAKKKSEIK